jgi:hypothetical protein
VEENVYQIKERKERENVWAIDDLDQDLKLLIISIQEDMHSYAEGVLEYSCYCFLNNFLF